MNTHTSTATISAVTVHVAHDPADDAAGIISRALDCAANRGGLSDDVGLSEATARPIGTVPCDEDGIPDWEVLDLSMNTHTSTVIKNEGILASIRSLIDEFDGFSIAHTGAASVMRESLASIATMAADASRAGAPCSERDLRTAFISDLEGTVLLLNEYIAQIGKEGA